MISVYIILVNQRFAIAKWGTTPNIAATCPATIEAVNPVVGLVEIIH